jgi:hypothetical protein
MKCNNGLYSDELFEVAFATVVLMKDYSRASPRRKLEMLLKECEEILMRRDMADNFRSSTALCLEGLRPLEGGGEETSDVLLNSCRKGGRADENEKTG